MSEILRAANMGFSEIKEGSVYMFTKEIIKQDTLNFANFSGDFNPLHVDPDFGERSIFKKNILHGMLVAGLFSTLVGMYCPGEKCLYLSQTLNFRLPVFYNETVTVKGTVLAKNESIGVITLKTEIIKQDKVAIYGEAKVKVLS